MALLRAELSRNPGDYYYLFQMGLACKSDQPQLAKSLFLQALRQGGDAMPAHLAEQAHMRLAQLCLQSDALPASIAHSRESLSMNPANLISRVCLITALVSSGGFRQALPHIEFVLGNGLGRVPNPGDFVQLRKLCLEKSGYSEP